MSCWFEEWDLSGAQPSNGMMAVGTTGDREGVGIARFGPISGAMTVIPIAHQEDGSLMLAALIRFPEWWGCSIDLTMGDTFGQQFFAQATHIPDSELGHPETFCRLPDSDED